jgi:tRNA modification GTPase
LPPPRTAVLRKLYNTSVSVTSPQLLDSGALILYLPAPNTVTGEDVLELHTHGGPAIVKAVLGAIPTSSRAESTNPGHRSIRFAEPGEFTKRAFYNNRLDLTQIEALGDSLSAETEQQRRLAVHGTQNDLGARYERWRQQLLYARGELEALIDFSEDQHFDEPPEDFLSTVSEQISRLRSELTLHIQNASKGELLRSGISIALLGAPNAGKSSLLNRIVGREAAIVSSEEGTTRDIIDVSVDIGGWLCRLGDMAGLRSEAISPVRPAVRSRIGHIEKEGMKRAKARALASDVVVVLLSLEESDTSTEASLHVDEELIDAARQCEKLGKPMILAINKIDNLNTGISGKARLDIYGRLANFFPKIAKEQIFLISCLEASDQEIRATDPGNIQNFLKGLTSFFATLTSASSPNEESFDKSYWEQSLSVSHRQSEYLKQCLQHLEDFASQANSPVHVDGHEDHVSEIDIVAAAEHLRFAADCLAKITGKGEAGDVEDLLGVVFEK